MKELICKRSNYTALFTSSIQKFIIENGFTGLLIASYEILIRNLWQYILFVSGSNLYLQSIWHIQISFIFLCIASCTAIRKAHFALDTFKQTNAKRQPDDDIDPPDQEH